MLGEEHFATSWVWAGYILDSGYFQFQPYVMAYFGEIAFFVFFHRPHWDKMSYGADVPLKGPK